jgi:O-antigen/teichoic acid export membrane protein
MLFSVTFFLNAAANFAFGLALSAILGPAEFGRYSTVALASITLAGAMLDWLRYSSLRFSGDGQGSVQTESSLEAGYLIMAGFAYAAAGAAALVGCTFGFGLALLLLTPLLAVAAHRVDFTGAKFRVRNDAHAFAAVYGLRQLFCFTLVLVVAFRTRDSIMTIAALVVANLIPAIALSARQRLAGARLSKASGASLVRFFVYAKPIVASLVIYQLIGLINRQAALEYLGAAQTGQLSLAADLGQRVFGTINSLPELMLFQYALERERIEGRAVAERQIAVNMTLVLALMALLASGYVAMAPTFEGLLVPSAYHGDFSRLSVELAPGFVAYCLMTSGLNPVFQLAGRTWPVTIASLTALATDLALLQFGGVAASADALARAYSISLGVGLVIGAALAFRNSAIRPSVRDVAVIVVIAVVVGFMIRPLNELHPHTLAAILALVVGGGVFGGTMLLCDVAGLRGLAAARWRASDSRRRAALGLKS